MDGRTDGRWRGEEGSDSDGPTRVDLKTGDPGLSGSVRARTRLNTVPNLVFRAAHTIEYLALETDHLDYVKLNRPVLLGLQLSSAPSCR